MAIQAQNIKLNIVPGGIIPIVNVSQFDVGRVLTFTIYDGNNPAVIPNGTTVSIEGLKPSNKAFTYNATISGNIVTVSTVQQMTIEGGAVACKLKLLNGEQNIGTAMFIMQVEVAGVTDGADTSETVLPAYMEAGRQNALNAEAWAVGTRGGVPVSSSDPQYENSSKYHAEQSEAHAEDSEAWATGKRNLIDVDPSDITYHNNSEYYSGLSESSAADAEYWSGKSQEYAESALDAINSVNAIVAIIKLLFGTIYPVTENGDHIITQSGDRIIISY